MKGFLSQPDRDHNSFPLLKPLLEEETIKKTGHNLKYEYIIFKQS